MQVEEPPFLTPANFSTEGKDVPAKKKKTTGENFYLKVRHYNNFFNYQHMFSLPFQSKYLPFSMHCCYISDILWKTFGPSQSNLTVRITMKLLFHC